MKIPRKTLKWAGAAAATALAIFGFEFLRFGGALRTLQPAFAGNCRTIALGGSSEDLQIDRIRGLAYLSLLDRVSVGGGAAVNGTILLLDLNLAEPTPRAAMAYDPENFRPHGLSLFKRGSRPARLFAVSHRSDGSHTIEIAEEGPAGGFFPKETIRNQTFVHPNAIAAAGVRQFYLANDTSAAGRWAQFAQILFRSGSSTLVYYDGTEARVEARDLNFVTGLALSPDATRLYVAETLAKALRVYRRDPATGALKLDETIELGTAPDNLNVDENGVVWIAAHPKLLSLLIHLRDSAKPAPTQVLRFDPRLAKPADGEKDARLAEIYVNAGEQISAGTVAARWRDEFLIGALLDRKVLICKPNP